MTFFRHERSAEVVHADCLKRALAIDGGTWVRDWVSVLDDDPVLLAYHGVRSTAGLTCFLCGESIGSTLRGAISREDVMNL